MDTLNTSIRARCAFRFAFRYGRCVGCGGVPVRKGHREGVVLQYMQMGVGWGEWASQVEHSSRGEQGCMWACTSIRVRSADRIAVRVRYGGVMVRHGHGRGCLGLPWSACRWGWGGVSGQFKWSIQVQEIGVGCIDGYTVYVHSCALRSSNCGSLWFVCGMWWCDGTPWPYGRGGLAVHANGGGVG